MAFSLLPHELETRLIGRQIVCLETTESTNLHARQLAEQGAADGTIVIADSQTGGKGRLGRSWFSPPKVNFYASVVLRPAITPREAAQLTFITSLAVAGALREACHLPAEVKWPNDILLNGSKVGGVLNELCVSVGQINYLVLGMGVNLNMPREQLPQRGLFPATSVLLETGEAVSRRVFARTCFQCLDRLYHQYLNTGFAGLRREWEAVCGMIGCHADLDVDGKALTGLVMGIDEAGALILRGLDGHEEKVFSADILAVRNNIKT